MNEARAEQIYREVEPSIERELTFGAFWELWGKKSGLERESLVEFWSEVEQQYIDLPAHNFDHAKESLWVAMDLVDLCEENGEAVNRKVVIWAVLTHDAGFHEDMSEHGFDSKEAYSAFILRQLMPKYDFTDEEIVLGEQAIISTKAGVKPVTLEDKITVRADLSNVNGDFVTSFFRKFLLFKEEAEMLAGERGESFSYVSFTVNTIWVLDGYFSNDLSLGEWDDDVWSNNVFQNLARLAKMPIEGFAEELANAVRELPDRAISSKLTELLFKTDCESKDQTPS